jgi:hypothetical protein
MDRGKSRGLGDDLLLVGLVVSLIGLMTVMTRLAAHTASSPSFSSEHTVDPVASSPATTAHVRLGRSTVSPDHLASHNLGGQGDARLDLRDAATMARWYLWTRPGGGETRTDLLINARAAIGSTSPPEASPAYLSPEE